MAPDDIARMINGMPSRFVVAEAASLEATIQFLIDGEGGGNFAIAIGNGACSCEEVRLTKPTLTLRMSAQTYIDLAIGRLKGPEAFFRRKLRYSGDMKLLLKMHKLFPALSAEDVASARAGE